MEHQDCQTHLSKLDKEIKEIREFDQQHMELHRQMMAQFKPIAEVFNNVNGFGKVSLLILKTLVLLGAGIGVIYGLVRFLKE